MAEMNTDFPSRPRIWRDFVVLGFALTLTLLLVDGVLGYQNARRMARHNEWVDHTQSVILALESLLSTVKDAETGQRGYLLTETDAYLQPYVEATGKVEGQLESIRRLTSDNPRQQARFAEVEKLVAARLAVIRQTIELEKRGDRSQAVALIRSDRGKQIMDALRRSIAVMEAEEHSLLRRRTAEATDSYRTLIGSFVLTTLTGLALVSAVFVLTLRNARVRQRAAATLADQRERLRITLASIGDGVISTDTQGRVTNLNAVAEELTGWTNASAVGEPLIAVFDIVNEETRQAVPNPVTKALRDGVIVGLANHTILIARDGTERFIDDSAAPIRSKDGQVVGCVLIFRDITAQRQADLTRQRNAADYRSLFEGAGTGNVEVELPSGRFVRINRKFGEMLGYSAEELLGGMTFLEVTHPDDRQRNLALIEPLLDQDSGSFDLEKRYVRKDGSILWASLTVTMVRNADGRTRLMATAIDITERRLAQERLAADLVGMQRLQALSTRMVQAGDLDSLLHEILSAAADVTGCAKGDIQLCDSATGELRTVVQQGLESTADLETQKALEEGIGSIESTSLVSRAGVLLGRLNSHYATPNRPPSQELRYLDLLARMAADFVERSQNEQALRDANRRQNEFLAMLAHELRNPLAPIRSALDVIKLSNGDHEIISHSTAMMERQVSQMVRFVDDLLDVSRISRGKIELRKGKIDLASSIYHAVEAAHPLCESMGNELVVSLPKETLHLDGDPARIAQVVGNLLNNACKFTNKGGRIDLIVEREGGQAVIRVRDTGIGIAAEQRSRIFDMFMQVDTSLERAVSGLGIGLKLVKTLIEMHDGTVEVHSAGLGQGSEFIVRLPLLAEPLPEPEPPVSTTIPAPAPRRVLIVDDNRDAATSLAKLLRLKGNEAATAHDGLEAIQVAEELRPELILCDIGLPKLDGYEVARRIREQAWGEGILLIAVTGWGQEEFRQRSKQAGFDAHLVKPVDFDTFTQLLATLDSNESTRPPS